MSALQKANVLAAVIREKHPEVEVFVDTECFDEEGAALFERVRVRVPKTKPLHVWENELIQHWVAQLGDENEDEPEFSVEFKKDARSSVLGLLGLGLLDIKPWTFHVPGLPMLGIPMAPGDARFVSPEVRVTPVLSSPVLANVMGSLDVWNATFPGEGVISIGNPLPTRQRPLGGFHELVGFEFPVSFATQIAFVESDNEYSASKDSVRSISFEVTGQSDMIKGNQSNCGVTTDYPKAA